MNDYVGPGSPNADTPCCIQNPCSRDLPPTPSRRSIVRLVGLLAVAALPAWTLDVRSIPKIVVVDGWILADTDLR